MSHLSKSLPLALYACAQRATHAMCMTCITSISQFYVHMYTSPTHTYTHTCFGFLKYFVSD